MEGVTIPCARCGAPLPILLGRRAVACGYCETEQPLPKEADARLRRHFHRIEALLEVAHLERTRKKRRPQRVMVAAFMIMLVATLIAVKAEQLLLVLIGGGICFVLLIAVGIVEHVTFQREPAPEAGRVTCRNCGAAVPFVVSSESLECPVCDRPLALEQRALAHAVRVAQEDLARAAEESGDPYGVSSRD